MYLRSIWNLVVILTSVCVGPAVALDGWRKVIGPERSFSIEMPDQPMQIEKAASGVDYTLHGYILQREHGAFLVLTAKYPLDVDVSNPRGVLKVSLADIAKSLTGGEWKSISWSRSSGAVTVDARGVRNGHDFRHFSMIKGHQIWWLTYSGLPGATRAPDAQRFFKSFHLL